MIFGKSWQGVIMDTTSIIIVDDTKEVLSSLKRELRSESYHIFYAKN